MLTETFTCLVSVGNFCLLWHSWLHPPVQPAPACGCTCRCAEGGAWWQSVLIGILGFAAILGWLPRLAWRPRSVAERHTRGQLTSGPPKVA